MHWYLEDQVSKGKKSVRRPLSPNYSFSVILPKYTNMLLKIPPLACLSEQTIQRKPNIQEKNADPIFLSASNLGQEATFPLFLVEVYTNYC